MCYSTISWKDCFNKGRVGNCDSDKAVCSNTFTAEKQKDDQQKSKERLKNLDYKGAIKALRRAEKYFSN